MSLHHQQIPRDPRETGARAEPAPQLVEHPAACPLPPIFHIIFDTEALSAYQRLFSLLMKIRLMAHSLEKLWKTRSRLSSDRGFCQLRHSMHFFISNLLYYLQVDVVDSEYAQLMSDLDEADEFQHVLRAHRNFLATVLKAALVDNLCARRH